MHTRKYKTHQFVNHYHCAPVGLAVPNVPITICIHGNVKYQYRFPRSFYFDMQHIHVLREIQNIRFRNHFILTCDTVTPTHSYLKFYTLFHILIFNDHPTYYFEPYSHCLASSTKPCFTGLFKIYCTFSK